MWKLDMARTGYHSDKDIMTVNDFRKYGKDMIDYICNYIQTVSSRRVNSDVDPFYLMSLLPDEAPRKPEEWSTIMNDIEDKLIPGVTHWNHPYFFAYFPMANSYPAVLGDMLSSALACQGFTWFASPVNTELTMVVLDWYGKALGLPKSFLHCSGQKRGGGCVQMSLVCFRLSKVVVDTDATEDELTELLLACINKSGKIHMVPTHIHGFLAIRFCVNYLHATEDLIVKAWEYIQECVNLVEQNILAQQDTQNARTLNCTDRTKWANLVKKYAHTMSVPLLQLRQQQERPSLLDCHSPVMVPQSSESIVEKVNIAGLFVENNHCPQQRHSC